MEESLVSVLLATSGLTALVGNRVKWNQIGSPATAPYVILRRISGRRDYDYSGPAGMKESRVQIDCYGSTYASAKATARAIETRLSGYRNQVGAVTFGAAFLNNERDLVDDTDGTADLQAVSLDFTIWHKEN